MNARTPGRPGTTLAVVCVATAMLMLELTSSTARYLAWQSICTRRCPA